MHFVLLFIFYSLIYLFIFLQPLCLSVLLSHYHHHHVLCLYTIFYQEPRSEPHQRGHLGGEQKHRFDVARKVRTLFPNDETPNLVCLFLAFPHFLSCFPIFFSYFFYGAHVFFSCTSSVLRKDLLILLVLLWGFSEGYVIMTVLVRSCLFIWSYILPQFSNSVSASSPLRMTWGRKAAIQFQGRGIRL